MNDGRPNSSTAHADFGLKPGVSFCRVDGRTVFLDVSADRYACLSPAAERAFTRLVDGLCLDDRDRAALSNLDRDGPLTRDCRGVPIASCMRVEVPHKSRLDEDAPFRLTETAAAATSLFLSPLRLRTFGLHRTLARVERRKRRASGQSTPQRQAHVAAAFARLRLVATEKDNCLTRSIAVAERLIGVGARPDLVMAVKLRPFYAHAWVQCEGWLVNDRHEFVRNYTPILVI